jgi:adenosylcobalamin-dependent ribonucleoside-triphosphate reductase
LQLLKSNDHTDVKFRLSTEFIDSYRIRPAPFGFGALGQLVYLRTYSRLKDDEVNEQWFETVQRVVEGTYSMQRRWVTANGLYWNQRKAQRSAQEMYERIFTMKFLPPGRGLWAMGSSLTEERGLWAALNNCAFVSTDNFAEDLTAPFTFLMEASMLGIGVGFDTKGAGQVTVRAPSKEPEEYRIPDTREGWVESLKRLLLAYFDARRPPVFNYDDVRAAGLPIKGFGGVSAGPEPLVRLHDLLRGVLDKAVGQKLSVTGITDIMNLIGKCVIAGNVRRTAEIAFGEYDSDEFMDLKNDQVNAERCGKAPWQNSIKDGWAWTSNNSIFAKLGMDYAPAANRVVRNGEPGFAWLENMRAYGRMVDPPNFKDKRVKGGNPCLEQSLESYELCCLVETFPANHDSLEDYQKTLKYAYLYGKTVTLGRTPWSRTNAVMLRNRRIGLSQSGVVQTIAKLGLEEYRRWCETGYQTVQEYDKTYSEWLVVPLSVKTTSIKPSGTVSLLAGATPGMHYPEAKTYIRRMRLSNFSDLLGPLAKAGYKIEPCVGDESSKVVEIPVKITDNIRVVSEVSLWEQMALAAFLQKFWADNQVSCTVAFDPKTEGSQIAHALDYFQYSLKGISFLPREEEGAYAQMPYEAITEVEYQQMTAGLKPLKFKETHEEAEAERFCTNDTCAVA